MEFQPWGQPNSRDHGKRPSDNPALGLSDVLRLQASNTQDMVWTDRFSQPWRVTWGANLYSCSPRNNRLRAWSTLLPTWEGILWTSIVQGLLLILGGFACIWLGNFKQINLSLLAWSPWRGRAIMWDWQLWGFAPTEPSLLFSEDVDLVGVERGAAVPGRGATFYSSGKAWKSASKDKWQEAKLYDAEGMCLCTWPRDVWTSVQVEQCSLGKITKSLH